MQVRHLAARGHARIGFGAVTDPREHAFCAPRLRGAREACDRLGLPAPVVAGVGYTPESGREAVDRWRGTAAPVTAVAGFNDLVALAVLAGAADAGLTVPGDLAVIGVDDLPVAALTRPGLTTIAIDAEVPAVEVARRILVEAGMPAPSGTGGPALRLVERATT